MINVSSQFLSSKPHFTSGEPVCDHHGWAWPAGMYFFLFFFYCNFLKQEFLCGLCESSCWSVAPSLLSSVVKCMCLSGWGACVLQGTPAFWLCHTVFHGMLGRRWGLDLKQLHSRFCWPTLRGRLGIFAPI